MTKRISLLCVIFLAIALALALVATPGLTAVAVEEQQAFEARSIEEDLIEMGFDLADYQYDKNGDLAVFSFMEYGYSEYVNVTDNYGLYVYVYNPQKLAFDFINGKNYIQIATSYDGNGAVVDFSKYQIGLVSSSEDNLYLKLKVIAGLNEIHNLVKGQSERRYTVSGLELHKKFDLNATEYSIASSFFYSGFAKGFSVDSNAESTLACRVEEIDTIELNVKHTTYKVFNIDENNGQELATVYFNVPDRYFNEYGALQQIKAEWLYSVTDYIYCTLYKDLYDKFNTVLGQDVAENKDLIYYFFSSIITSGAYTNLYDVYNYVPSGDSALVQDVFYPISRINWLMYKDVDDIDKLVIDSEELISYYKEHKDSINLLSYVDADKTVVNVDAGDKFDLSGFNDNKTFWNAWKAVWYPEIMDDTIKDISPIYVLQASDLVGSDEDIANTLFVNKSDVSDIKLAFAEIGTKTVLFRFAVNDFQSQDLSVQSHGNAPQDFVAGENLLYRTKLPFYQDFDIIQLGFKKAGTVTIIPVVSNPTNVIGDTVPPVNDLPEWLKDKADGSCDEVLTFLQYLVIAIVLCFILFVVIKIVSSISNVKHKKRVKDLHKASIKKTKSIRPPKV